MHRSDLTRAWVVAATLVLVAIPAAARSPVPAATAQPTTTAPTPIGPIATGPPPSPPVGEPWQRSLDVPGGSLMIDVVTCGQGFAGLAYRPDGDDRPDATVWRSPDGVAWTAVGQPFPGLGRDASWSVEELVRFRGELFAVGVHGPRLVLWRSADCGLTWRRVPDRPAFLLGRGDVSLNTIETAATSERLLIVGSQGGEGTPRRWWSWSLVPGGTWTELPIAAAMSAARYGLGATGTTFFGVDIVGGNALTGSMLVMSPDGAAWRTIGALPGIGVPIWDPTGARYLLATQDGEAEAVPPVLWASTDGRAWEVLATGSPGSPDWGTGVWAVRGTILWVTDTVDGNTGLTWSWSARSDDGGATWSVSAGWPDMDFTGANPVAMGPTAIVLGGGSAFDTTRTWMQQR